MCPPPGGPTSCARRTSWEEVGRVHGYERIPETPVSGIARMGGPRGGLLREDRLREAVVRQGYVQIVAHSLRDLSSLDAPGGRLAPRNPGSPEAAYLRNALLPGLAEAAARNGARDLRLFEIGRTFAPKEGKTLAFLATDGTDFFGLKGDVLAAFAAIGEPVELTPAADDPRFHPGRQARLSLAGEDSRGVIGQPPPGGRRRPRASRDRRRGGDRARPRRGRGGPRAPAQAPSPAIPPTLATSPS